MHRGDDGAKCFAFLGQLAQVHWKGVVTVSRVEVVDGPSRDYGVSGTRPADKVEVSGIDTRNS